MAAVPRRVLFPPPPASMVLAATEVPKRFDNADPCRRLPDNTGNLKTSGYRIGAQPGKYLGDIPYEF